MSDDRPPAESRANEPIEVGGGAGAGAGETPIQAPGLLDGEWFELGDPESDPISLLLRKGQA